MGVSRSKASIFPTPAVDKRQSPCQATSSPVSVEYLLEKWVESPKKRFVPKQRIQKATCVENCIKECHEARIREENCLSKILQTLGETEEEASRRQWVAKRRKVLDTVGVNHGSKKTQSTASGKVRISLQLDVTDNTSKHQRLRSATGGTNAAKTIYVPTMGTELQIAWDEEISPSRSPTPTSLQKRTMNTKWDSSSALDWLTGETLVTDFTN